MEAKHQLAAIVFTDAVGSSQSMRENEEGTLSALHEDLSLMREVCGQHGGEVLKSTGDGLMMLFKSASQAVLCGLDIQQRLGLPEKGSLQHRIGIHLGDVYLSDGDAHGDGVNVASRLQELASPGCICLSKTVLDVARSRLLVQPKAIGVRQLKGMDEGIEIFEIAPDAKPRKSPPTKRTPTGAFLPAFGMVVLAIVAVAAFITRPWEPKTTDETPPITPIRQASPPTSPDNALRTELAQARKDAEDAKKMAAVAEQKGNAKTEPSPTAPAGTPTQALPPKTPVTDSSDEPVDPDLSGMGAAFMPDPEKFADGIKKTTQAVLESIPAGIKGMHVTLAGYPEQAVSHWKTRDFLGMAEWMRKQPWISSTEGKAALHHWVMMSDFKDWYLSQMRLYSPEKPLTATRAKGGEVTAWMLPGDLIAYQLATGRTKKGGFDTTPLWLISATVNAVLVDTQEPKKHMQGLVAMQVEQRVQKLSDAPEPAP